MLSIARLAFRSYYELLRRRVQLHRAFHTDHSKEIVMRMKLSSMLLATAVSAYVASAAPPVADVGDADSFGRTNKYLGAKSGPMVWLRTDCAAGPSNPMGPNDRCVVVNANGPQTAIDQADLASIRLPGGSTHSLICFAITTVYTYTLVGPSTGKAQGLFLLNHAVTIQSNVFNNPALTDPYTGQPMNGRITIPLSGFYHSQTLQAGESVGDLQTNTRSCIGGIVSIASLKGTYGLTTSQVNAFFANPVTVTLGATGQVFRSDRGQYSMGFRLYGD